MTEAKVEVLFRFKQLKPFKPFNAFLHSPASRGRKEAGL
jgi:hypothetical protein